MNAIYWPPTRPRGDGGLRANWGWDYYRKPSCKAMTPDPEEPDEYEIGCDRPNGHTGRHFAWGWSSDRCVVIAVWGDKGLKP